MSNYLDQLNPSQRDAVMCMDGPSMIIAGAGSGKTRVLTYRIVHMLHNQVDPFNILALTFTNKAAREMKDRVISMVGNDAMSLWMGTFHSVFAKLLRIEAEKIGFPAAFTIYDADDSKNLVKKIIQEQQLDDKNYKPSLVLNRISSAKNNLFSVSDYLSNDQLMSEDRMAGKPKIGELYQIYQKRLKQADAMDFDDLLFNTYLLLKNHPDALLKYQKKFRYIMVDEFQDTNYAQYIIVRKLAAQHENICVVGDDAQSIYAFRGANIQNILNFEKDYPDLKTFKLEQNYRSTKTIVGAANNVIANNRHQLKKEVWTDNINGEKIRLLRAISDNEEGNQIANTIFEDRMNHQYKNKDFAILYRTNAQSRSLEEALRKLNIPYRIYGGLSFFKRKEIKDLLAYFRLTINHADEEALERVYNYPIRGIGKTSYEKLMVMADQRTCTIWNVMEDIHDKEIDIASATKTKISDFVTMIKSFAVMSKTQNAYDVASHIAQSSGLLKELFNDKSSEGVSHYENIQELLAGIKEFSERGNLPLESPSSELRESDTRLLNEYMQDIALLTDAENKDDGNDDKVSLMTIHQAKGLEFKEVFVSGLEENLFPSQLSINSREDMEEERRLFYVAVTRAEKRLTLSYAMTRYRWGNLTGCEPSRFLSEINPEFVDIKFAPEPTTQRGGRISGDDNLPTYSNNSFTKNKLKPLAKKPAAKAVDPKLLENFTADDPLRIEIGMQVLHQRFGKGKVMSLEGRMPDLKAVVNFENGESKQLLLKYARLKIVEQP
ncbi:MAG: ATP-dependent DNA helicase PcrA [Bacteroidetes bacterium ADurb.Bin141]|nr:MAG: ATP-dependent DNA helicase PcrA [Bacteroidetes bacterium ADurb.Bin141]